MILLTGATGTIGRATRVSVMGANAEPDIIARLKTAPGTA
jgi:nucleoside-diphosphate-sugar epimerase